MNKPMKPRILATALLFALSLFASSAIAQEAKPTEQVKEAKPAGPVTLRPKWEAGQTARYEFWSKTVKNEKALMLGKEQTKSTTYITDGTMTWTVDEVAEDGSAVCTLKLNNIKFTIGNGKDEPKIIDSQNLGGDQPVFDSLVTAMVSTPLKVSVNADGTIAGVEGVDAMNTAAGQEAVDAKLVPEEIDFMETASELATLIAAPASATPGQTWNAKNTWNHDSVIPGTDTLGEWDTNFSFASVSNIAGVPIATIKSKSTIDMKVDLSKLPERSPDVDVQINGATGRGEILFDLSRHETVARNDSMSYTANITISPPNDRIPPIKITVNETSQSQLLRIGEGAD